MILIIILFKIFGDEILHIYCFECMIFGIKHGYKVNESFLTIQAKSKISCASLCFREPNCRTANFNKIDKICEFSERSLNSAEITSQDGYTVFGNSKFTK